MPFQNAAGGYFTLVSDVNSRKAGVQQVIDPLGSVAAGLYPIDYSDGTSTFGHYRAIAVAGAVNALTAGQIIQSIRWADSSRLMVVTRYAVALEVVTAMTTASVMDLKSFIFRGSTANASGTGSTTLTLTGNNQKTRASMGATLFASNGEIRTAQGAGQPITAASGKTNDSAPFGAVFFGSLFDSTATGVAVKVWPGAAITPGGWQDLFVLQPGVNHPIVLATNEGIETQVITANNGDGTVNYAFLIEWLETSRYFTAS